MCNLESRVQQLTNGEMGFECVHLTQTLGYYACPVIPGKLNLWNMYVLRHVSVHIKRTSAFLLNETIFRQGPTVCVVTLQGVQDLTLQPGLA